MINLRARRKYFYYSLIRWSVTILFLLPFVIYGLICFVSALIHSSSNITISQYLFIYLSIPGLAVNLFFVVFGSFYRKRLRNDVISEFYEIVSLTKLPDKLPQVVYVYTCHGDMMQARVLQNSMQTYPNMEVWISEGSEKPEVIEASRKFALEHGFKFYAVGGNGSANKAENLNAFLKNACPYYDYLLITDSDEALDKNVVDYALKCFHSSKFKNLGFVSPVNYVYPTKGAFSNICCNMETRACLTGLNKLVMRGDACSLSSFSCLISKELIHKNGGVFPDGCLEDVYLESFAIRNGFSSIFLPIAPCGESFDKNIFAYFNRTLRIKDWGILLAKRDKYKQYNEKYPQWFSKIINPIWTPLNYLLFLIGLVIFVWLISSFHTQLLHNILFIYLLCTICVTFLAWLIMYFTDSVNWAAYNKFGFIMFIFIWPLFILAQVPYTLSRWYKATIKSQYSGFGGSNQKQVKTNKNRKLLIINWCAILISAILIGVIAFVYCKYAGFANIYWNIGFITAMILLGLIFLSYLSINLLYFMGKIKYNDSYNELDFIQLPEFYRKRLKSKGEKNGATN